jgi:hypothetical protein
MAAMRNNEPQMAQKDIRAKAQSYQITQENLRLCAGRF